MFFADVALSVAAHDPWVTNDGLGLALALCCGCVGFVVARAQPQNPIGWIFLGLVLLVLAWYLAELYLVLDYRQHDGRLPLGAAAAYFQAGFSILPVLVGTPVILLFPDGRLTRRWRWVLRAYVCVAAWFMAAQYAGAVAVGLPSPVAVDIRGTIRNTDGGTIATLGWLTAPLFLGFWGSFVVRQFGSWRSSSGDRHAQLKWLTAGGAIAVVACILAVLTGNAHSTAGRVANDLALTGIFALPVSIAVAILRYRLYEIDRIISRTLSYALLTAILVGTFAGTVLLTTRVLPFSSPVAVAASTLAAAALFNPLRTHVQRLVDRRFNRARYDREALVAGFVAKLRDAVDSETVVSELAEAVSSAVEPAHVSVWIAS